MDLDSDTVLLLDPGHELATAWLVALLCPNMHLVTAAGRMQTAHRANIDTGKKWATIEVGNAVIVEVGRTTLRPVASIRANPS